MVQTFSSSNHRFFCVKFCQKAHKLKGLQIVSMYFFLKSEIICQIHMNLGLRALCLGLNEWWQQMKAGYQSNEECIALEFNLWLTFDQTIVKWQKGVVTISPPSSSNFVTFLKIQFGRVVGDFKSWHPIYIELNYNLFIFH
jgi:hypothetical protein